MDVKTSLESVDEVTKQLTVSIPADEVAREVDEEIGKLSKNAQLKGFRPGKAPKNVVKKKHGGRVHSEVAYRMISATLRDAVQNHELDMVGEPEIDIISVEPGASVEYKANIFLFPTPEISHYEAFEVEVPRGEVEDKDVDEHIDQLRDSKATPQKLEFRTKAEKGDIVDASIEVIVEGSDESRPEPVVIELGSGRLPAELEDGIVGMEIGEMKEIGEALPDDKEDNASGRKYKVLLSGLSEKVLPELNDEFAKNAGIEGVETVLELRLKVREQIAEKVEEETRSETHAAILKQLVERNEFVVPQIMVDNEIRHMLVQAGLLNPQQTDPARISVESFRQHFNENALSRVRTAIAVDRVAEQENLAVSDDELETAMNDLADKSGMPLEDIKKHFADESQALNFRLDQTRNKVLEFLQSRAKINYTEKVAEAEEGTAEVK